MLEQQACLSSINCNMVRSRAPADSDAAGEEGNEGVPAGHGTAEPPCPPLPGSAESLRDVFEKVCFNQRDFSHVKQGL